MSQTRQEIVEALQTVGQATVNELASMVDVKAITIRHHLNVLRAEGAITVQEERQPVGRPVLIYTLTERVPRQNGRQHHRLADRLLAQVKDTFSPEVARTLISGLAEQIVSDMEASLADLPPAERRAHLIDILNREGFAARWQQTDDGLKLVEYQCPYYDIGQHHPEVCEIDETLIRVAINQQVEKEACQLSGDRTCTFAIIE